MEKEKKLLKNTALYMVGNVTSKIIAFLLVPLYTHYLNQSEMGTSDLILNAVSLIIPLITLSSVTSIFRFILDDDSYTDKIITNGLVIIFTGVAISIIPFCFFAAIIQVQYFGLTIILLLCMLLDNTWKYLTRATKNNFSYAVSGVFQTIVTGISAITFIVGFGWGTKGILLSYSLAAFTSFIYMESKIKACLRVKLDLVDKKTIQSMLKYSLPLVPNDVTWWLIQSSNRFIIKYFLGVASNGIYAVSTKFPTLLMTFNSLFNMAWTESAIEEFNSAKRNEHYTKVFNSLLKLQFSVFLVVLPITKFVFNLMIDESFSKAKFYVPFLLLAAIFHTFAVFYGAGFLSSKETGGALSTTVVSAVINILVLLCSIRFLGLMAAAIAEFIGYVVLWLTRVKKTKKYFEIKLDFKLLVYFIFMSALFICCYYLDNFVISVLMTFISAISFFAINKDIIYKILELVFKKYKKA